MYKRQFLLLVLKVVTPCKATCSFFLCWRSLHLVKPHASASCVESLHLVNINAAAFSLSLHAFPSFFCWRTLCVPCSCTGGECFLSSLGSQVWTLLDTTETLSRLYRFVSRCLSSPYRACFCEISMMYLSFAKKSPLHLRFECADMADMKVQKQIWIRNAKTSNFPRFFHSKLTLKRDFVPNQKLII